jgi:hypothetical protein
MQPRIDRTRFGLVTIGGTDYEHDVLIRLGGKIDKRKRVADLPERRGVRHSERHGNTTTTPGRLLSFS